MRRNEASLLFREHKMEAYQNIAWFGNDVYTVTENIAKS